MIICSPEDDLRLKAEEYAVSAMIREYGIREAAAVSAAERLRGSGILAAAEGDSIVSVLFYDHEAYRILLLSGDSDLQRKSLLEELKRLFSREYAARISVLSAKENLEFYRSCGFERCGDEMSGMVPMEYLLGREMIGKPVLVTVDHPLGSLHPSLADAVYTVNTGYVILNEEITDAYVIGPEEPLDTFSGIVCGIIYRRNSDRIRLIVMRAGEMPDREEIIRKIGFEEQYYETRIIWD